MLKEALLSCQGMQCAGIRSSGDPFAGEGVHSLAAGDVQRDISTLVVAELLTDMVS